MVRFLVWVGVGVSVYLYFGTVNRLGNVGRIRKDSERYFRRSCCTSHHLTISASLAWRVIETDAMD